MDKSSGGDAFLVRTDTNPPEFDVLTSPANTAAAAGAPPLPLPAGGSPAPGTTRRALSLTPPITFYVLLSVGATKIITKTEGQNTHQRRGGAPWVSEGAVGRWVGEIHPTAMLKYLVFTYDFGYICMY